MAQVVSCLVNYYQLFFAEHFALCLKLYNKHASGKLRGSEFKRSLPAANYSLYHYLSNMIIDLQMIVLLWHFAELNRRVVPGRVGINPHAVSNKLLLQSSDGKLLVGKIAVVRCLINNLTFLSLEECDNGEVIKV